MTQFDRRIAALESRFQPIDHASANDFERGWFLALCRPSYVRVLRWYASALAERRYHHERGTTTSFYSLDWHQGTTAEERETRIQTECDRLTDLMRDQGGDAALTAWIETADQEGWPDVVGGHGMDRAGFEAELERSRASDDASRQGDMPGSEM